MTVEELEVEELEGEDVEDKSDEAEPTLLPPPQPSKAQLDVTTSKDDMNFRIDMIDLIEKLN